MTAVSMWSYPALIAALGQNRPPSFGEMRQLVRRIRFEVIRVDPRANAHRWAVRRLVAAVLQRPASHGASKE